MNLKATDFKVWELLTVNEMILSKSITGAMWKSNTKYWRRETYKNHTIWFWFWQYYCFVGYLIVVRAVGAFLHRSELFGVAHLKVFFIVDHLKVFFLWCPGLLFSKFILSFSTNGQGTCVIIIITEDDDKDDEYNIMKKPGHRQLGPCWDQPVVEPLSQWCISGSKLLEIYLVYLSW